MEEEKRQGRGTSSQAYRIVASIKNGQPSSAFYTYAEEVAIERTVGRRLTEEVTAKSLSWGSLMECVVFNSLPGFDYRMEHKNTTEHFDYPELWSGTPDLISDTKTAEIKCYFLKKFMLFSKALRKGDINEIKKDFPQPYWQLVSNCILTKKNVGELIVYIPTRSQLEQVLDAVENTDFLTDWNLNPIDYYQYRTENIEKFPYMPDGTKFDNLNTLVFEIPSEDKKFLTDKFLLFKKEVEKKEEEFNQ